MPGRMNVAPGDPAHSVVVPREVGIDPEETLGVDRLAPRTRRVVGVDDELSARDVMDVRGRHPESSAVVAQCRCVDPAARPGEPGAHVQLRRTIEDVPQLRPLDEVARAEDRHTGEVLERGCGEVVLVADTADRGVGVESGKDGELRHIRPSLLSRSPPACDVPHAAAAEPPDRRRVMPEAAAACNRARGPTSRGQPVPSRRGLRGTAPPRGG